MQRNCPSALPRALSLSLSLSLFFYFSLSLSLPFVPALEVKYGAVETTTIHAMVGAHNLPQKFQDYQELVSASFHKVYTVLSLLT